MNIQTYIFFDLETTGLIEGKHMPKITEIALLALSRKSISNNHGNFLPRIMHKLVLPINPQKNIPPRVEHITQLSNENMQLLQPFKCEIYDLIKYFLQRLTPPICFVAHNGNNFDYPILLWELECINKILDINILCIDTLKMFKNFFKEKQNDIISCPCPCPSNLNIMEDLLNDKYNDSLCAMLDTLEETKIDATTSTSSTFLYEDRYTKVLDYVCDTNEKSDDVDSKLSKDKREINERALKDQRVKLQYAQQLSKKNNRRRKSNLDPKRQPVNFKLTTIHKYMFGSNFACEHSAEADCLSMIRCVSQIADFFLEWSDNHATPLIYYRRT